MTLKATTTECFDFDETVTLQVNLKNVGTVDATNVVAKLRSDSPYITIIDSVANCGNINAETEFLIENDFVIKAAKDIPDQTKVDLQFLQLLMRRRTMDNNFQFNCECSTTN